MFAALLAAALVAHGTPAFQLAANQTKGSAVTVHADADSGALPAGAPTDDYALVAWCYGALSRHMELHDQVWPEVQRIEAQFPQPGVSLKEALAAYDDQHKAGLAQLDLYAKALDLGEVAGKTGGLERTVAIQVGRDVWQGSDGADPKELARAWMDWALPGQCPDTANKMLGQ